MIAKRLLAALCLLALPALADIPGVTISAPAHSPQIFPRLLAVGADGRVWFADERFTPHSVGFFTLANSAPKVFAIPCAGCSDATNISYIESIVVGPDGGLWLIWTHVRSDGSPLNGGVNSFVSKVTPEGVFTDYPITTKDAFRRYIFAAQGNSTITAGPDGNLWFTENAAHKIGRITPAGVVTEYALANFSSPSGIVSGPDGNLWFTESASRKIGRITTGGAITEFAVPATSSQPYAIISATDGNLWFSDRFGRIGRVTPAGSITLYDLEPQSGAQHLAQLPGSGKIYVLYSTNTAGKLARFDPAAPAATALGPVRSHTQLLFENTVFPDQSHGYFIVGLNNSTLGLTLWTPQPDGTRIDGDRIVQEKVEPCPPPAEFYPRESTFRANVGEPFAVSFSNRETSSGAFSVTTSNPIPGLSLTGEGTTLQTLSGRLKFPGRSTIFVSRIPFDSRAECRQSTIYTLEVQASGCHIIVDPEILPDAVAGEPYSARLRVYPWAVPKYELPNWVRIFGPVSVGGAAEYRIEGTPASGDTTAVFAFEGPCPSSVHDQVALLRTRENGSAPTPPRISANPIVDSEESIGVDVAAPGEPRWRVAESESPDMSNARTTTTAESHLEFFESSDVPKAFYFQATPLDGPAANTPSPVTRSVVQPVPTNDRPGSAVHRSSSALTEVERAFLLNMPLRGVWSAQSTFTASIDNPAFTLNPSSGVVPASGTIVTVTADRSKLPAGTTTGLLRFTETTESGTTKTTSWPVSIALNATVAPVPRSRLSGGSAVIPAVTHARGANGAEFRSDVRITNSGSSDAAYVLTFTPSLTDGTKNGLTTHFSIRAGETLALDDVLPYYFGPGALGESAGGTLTISPGSEGAKFIATSRTYNWTSSGTFGQFIPAAPPSKFAARGVVQSLQQVADSAAYRTNLGLVEGKGEPVSLVVRVFDAAGTKLKEIPVDLQPGEHRQLNGFLRSNGVTLDDGRIEVEVTSSTGSVTSYASVVDNRTNDPLCVTPVNPSSDALARSVLPGVADLNAGANFHTDMRVWNPSTTRSATVTLTYAPQGPLPATKVKQLTIAPNAVGVYDDVLPTLFDIRNSGGAILVETDALTPVIVSGRTYSRSGDGTYGQFIPAVSARDAAAPGGRALNVTLLEESASYRTNIGISEVTGNSARVRLTATTTPGTAPGVVEIDLQPNEFRQFGNFLRQAGLGDAVYNARVTIEVIGGSGRVAAYASVVDNRTQDPTYVPAQ